MSRFLFLPRSSVFLFLGLFFIHLGSLEAKNLTREQETLDEGLDFIAVPSRDSVESSSEEGSQPEVKKEPTSWRYFFRILSAPVVLMANYPKSEETDMYQMYLEHVNKGINRSWKKRGLDSKKKELSPKENEEGTEDQEGSSADEPKGSQTY